MEEAAPALRVEAATAAAHTTGYEPSPLSVQVRGMRTGGDAQARIQDNMLLAFKTLMPRLDAVYASRSAAAPDGFEERINFWHRECGLPTELRSQLHSLRIWANAARHHDAARWRRDGPRSEGEASRASCRGDGGDRGARGVSLCGLVPFHCGTARVTKP